MVNKTSILSKQLAQTPIAVPGSPFWEVFKTFGRDEAYAWIFNTLGTLLMEFALISWLTIGAGSHKIVLALTGPIIEKFGFFIGHFKDAHNIYKTTPLEAREKLSVYLKKAFKAGSKSLTYDLLVHDPVYIIIMLVGQYVLPTTPAWVLAMSSFVAAVFIVAGLDVGVQELRYFLFKLKLKKLGFESEKYLESRFLISSKQNPAKLIKEFAKEFGLKKTRSINYYDTYYKNKLKTYSGRKPKLRLRKRTATKGDWFKTVQVTYNIASRIESKTFEQFNFFPQRKEKIYFVIKEKMPLNIEHVKNKKIKHFLINATNNKQEKNTPLKIQFERFFAFGPELVICVDKIKKLKRDFYVVELKTHRDQNLLKEAMRFVMMHYPVVQTTHGKLEIKSNSKHK